MHSEQVIHEADNQPEPTLSPILRVLTMSPTATISPIISCPGIMGY